MTNNANLSIPAKRYFTLEEVCQLMQISAQQFAQWQHENGTVIGYGGERYTRSDVVKLLKLKNTFSPYMANEEILAVDGSPAADTEEIRNSLKAVLADLEQTLAN